MWSETKFFEAFKRHGLLQGTVVYVSQLTGESVTVSVGYFEPDRRYLGAAQSKDYEIEYQTHELPDLETGSELTVNGIKFRVREPPFVDELGTNNGFFRRAILTKL